MARGLHYSLSILVVAICLVGTGSSLMAQSVVNLKKTGDGWQLIRNGKPYYVNGAGCDGPIGDLASFGANSIRTWHYRDDTRKVLDEAHAKGLSVTIGIWLGHERHGVSYQDYDTMTKQIDSVLKCVREFKDHPAVLMWGVGNEMEGEGANPAIWSHIEFLASQVKKEDPNHPVMTVIAEVGGRKVEAIHKLCPSIDVVGINSYGGGPSVGSRYLKLNGTKPYLITEFGPIGTWEVGKNNLGAILEASGQAKGEQYRSAYESFKADSANCLGSYAFLWGHKQEATSTWFGMLLPNGNRTAAVDVMSELWTGKKPTNLCPKIIACTLEGANEVDKNTIVKVKLDAVDPENDSLNVEWIMTDESSSYATGGDLQATPDSYKDRIQQSDLNGAQIKMPESGGLYRIYAYVDDGKGGGAVANIPIRVKGSAVTEPGKKVALPFVVFSETFAGTPFAASGYMGSAEALKLDAECKVDPRTGENCLSVQFNRGDEWGGVVWQSPADDWGDQPGGFDLTGAKKLSFWVRSKKGGEEVSFGLGVLGRDKKFFDTAKREEVIKLTDKWEQHTIDIEGADLQRIKTGFFFSVAGQGDPIEFYLDDIKYE